MCKRFIVTGVLAAVCIAAPVCHAGLYEKDSIYAFDVDANGYATPATLDNFITAVNIVRNGDNPANEAAKTLRDIIARSRSKGLDRLGPVEIADYSAAMLRLRDEYDKSYKEALDYLSNLKGRPPAGAEFFVLAHLAHAFLMKGDYQNAYALEYSAVKDYEFPGEVIGLNRAQRSWYQRLEEAYVLPFIRNRLTEANVKKASVEDGLDPIFAGKSAGKKDPVSYVGESGHYEAGAIAAAERAKLPPDAIAIVQQLLLWNPGDGRLWWQLAELYNAAGDLKSAERVFTLCTWEHKYSNSQLKEHRAIVMTALESQTQEAETSARLMTETRRRKWLTVGAGVSVVLVLVCYWQGREFVRRMRRRSR